jgi:hypothetical protein
MMVADVHGSDVVTTKSDPRRPHHFTGFQVPLFYGAASLWLKLSSKEVFAIRGESTVAEEGAFGWSQFEHALLWSCPCINPIYLATRS